MEGEGVAVKEVEVSAMAQGGFARLIEMPEAQECHRRGLSRYA
jgi:hypothetical protein